MPTQTDALPTADAVPDADRSGVYCSFVRISADLLLVWRVCRNGACRRARACRGDGEHCIQHNFPRLPEGVQECTCGCCGLPPTGRWSRYWRIWRAHPPKRRSWSGPRAQNPGRRGRGRPDEGAGA